MSGTALELKSAWDVEPSGFPAKGTVEDAIRFCLRYAILAPSSHNTQPWWFRIHDDGVTVGLDVSRGLAVSDPDDREGVMSVGAALFNLRVALARFGLDAAVQSFPDPLDPEACARVDVRFGRGDALLEPLFEAVSRRRTSHATFADTPVDPLLLTTVMGDAAAEGASLRVFGGPQERERLAALVSEGDRTQMASHPFRRELALWLRRPIDQALDGLHGCVSGSPLEELTLSDPLVVRTFDMGGRRAARDRDLAIGSPAMLVLSTAADGRSDWLRAGQALQRVLLRLTDAGLSAGFLNQAIEVADLRTLLAEMLADGTVPQLLIRVGHGPVPEPQPRRDLEQFLGG